LATNYANQDDYRIYVNLTGETLVCEYVVLVFGSLEDDPPAAAAELAEGISFVTLSSVLMTTVTVMRG